MIVMCVAHNNRVLKNWEKLTQVPTDVLNEKTRTCLYISGSKGEV